MKKVLIAVLMTASFQCVGAQSQVADPVIMTVNNQPVLR